MSKDLFTSKLPIPHFFGWLSLSIFLMVMDHQQRLSSLRSFFHVYHASVMQASHWPFHAVHSLLSQVQERHTMMRENASLHAKNLLLQAEIDHLTVLQKENKSLRALLSSSVQSGGAFIVTDLIAIPNLPNHHYVLIRHGKEAKVYVGQPVIDAKGVVGQVVYVARHSAMVMLLSDAKSAIPVETKKGVRAIAVGRGMRGEIFLKHVPDHNKLKEGDVLYSSGLGLRYPSGYPVGKIYSIKTDPGKNFAQVKVKPSAELERSRMMLLVWPSRQHKMHRHELLDLEKEIREGT